MDSLASLIDRVGHALHGASYAAGLNPAQWAALRYFARANRFSRTPGAFARYHATSPGTASQTVKSLVDKGLLERRRDPRDGRRRELRPSPAGARVLVLDPLAHVDRAAAALPAECRDQAGEALGAVLDALGGVDFGACGACRHLRREERDGEPCRHACVLAGEALEEDELRLVCVNFAH